MKSVLGGLAGALFLLSGGLASQGQSRDAERAPVPPQRHFEVRRASSKIHVDGVLDERAWSDALVVDLPWEWTPGDNVPSTVPTDCLVTYDEHNLYFGFRAFDPEPARIRAHLMDRDQLSSFVQDDHVGVMIDTFNDERRAFQFRVNPLGVQMDAVFSELIQNEDFSWDAIWHSAGRITAEGYVVEIAVPLKQLRFPRRGGVQTWGFEAFRSYPRTYRHRMASKFTDRSKDCILCQENKITGFEGIRPGRNLELDPTLTALRTDELDAFPGGELAGGDEDVDLGLNVRWGITPNLSLNAAVNPDFSQVEADVAQLAINTRFALFFPEKRPFFLEGADFFVTPLPVVFTRTIFDPRWGVKLTGKEGRNAIGVVVADDDHNNLTIPFNQCSISTSDEDEVRNGILRYRRDVGTHSTLGVLFTGREADDYSNRVYGADGYFRFTTSDILRFQFLHSDTAYSDKLVDQWGGAKALSGDAFMARYDHLSRDWIGFFRYENLGADFRADSGFVPRVDVRTMEVGLSRKIWGDAQGWFSGLTFGVRGLRSDDQGGELSDQTVEVTASYAGPMQSVIELALSSNKEAYAGARFDLDRGGARFEIHPNGAVSLDFEVESGEVIDLDNVREGDGLTLSSALELKAGRRLNLQLALLRHTLDVPGGELFEADLSQLRLVYQFNVRTFVRAIMQYTDIEKDPDLYFEPVEREEKDLFTQLLFSYKLNPQTVLFVGYTDSRRGLDTVSLTQTGRTFFLKLGYAFLY